MVFATTLICCDYCGIGYTLCLSNSGELHEFGKLEYRGQEKESKVFLPRKKTKEDVRNFYISNKTLLEPIKNNQPDEFEPIKKLFADRLEEIKETQNKGENNE